MARRKIKANCPVTCGDCAEFVYEADGAGRCMAFMQPGAHGRWMHPLRRREKVATSCPALKRREHHGPGAGLR